MNRKNLYHKLKGNVLVAACALITFVQVSCDVHEFPVEEAAVPVALRLKFETDMPWSMYVSDIQQQGMSIRSLTQAGMVRCIVRLYQQSSYKRADVSGSYQEFVYTTTVENSDDNVFSIDILPGDYLVMVWADYIYPTDTETLYDANDFSDIKIRSPYIGNIDYRDAFRGSTEITLSDFNVGTGYNVISIDMSRPLAKYEFISTDLKEFLVQEAELRNKKAASTAAAASSVASDTTVVTKNPVDFSNYRIRFFYEGYLPISYSMFTDKPVDAVTGISFDGSFNVLSDEEVSLGFDYVFVNHKETSISVRMALYNQEGELISLTQPIDVPLKRSTKTVMRGRYLMEKTNGSVFIDPSYDDEYNIIL